MTVNASNGVVNQHPNIPVIPNPTQTDSTGAITAGNAGHVEMDIPNGMQFVSFEMVKFENDTVPKDTVEIFVRLMLPGDVTTATIPKVKTTTQGASFKPRPYMELPPTAGCKLSFVSTVSDHGMILTYAQKLAALGIAQP